MMSGRQQGFFSVRASTRLFLLLALVAHSACWSSSSKPSPDACGAEERDGALLDLVPGMDWSQWYRDESGYVPDSRHFGAYLTVPVGDRLYLGWGTGLPTLGDGALVARFDGTKVERLGVLAEEGFHEMIWDELGGTLHIAGTDPSWPEDWSAGNHYTYQPSRPEGIVKHRDPLRGLVNVIHTWGLWMRKDRILYAAVSSHDGSFRRHRNLVRRFFDRINWFFDPSYYSTGYGVTRLGQIFQSTDGGTSWSRVSDLGDFRAYDVLGADERLYALYADTPESACKLAVSEDGGKSWRDRAQDDLDRIHLIPFAGQVVAVGHDGRSIYAVSPDSLRRFYLPPGCVVESHFNALAEAEDELYVVCAREEGGYSILSTRDLRQWRWAACSDEQLVSISYWPAQKALILGSAGARAKLWRLDRERAVLAGS